MGDTAEVVLHKVVQVVGAFRAGHKKRPLSGTGALNMGIRSCGPAQAGAG